jgi:hypothetical protein
MMIGLEEAALLAFSQDNCCVNDLVELGQIKEPAVECKPFVPNATNVGPLRAETVSCEMKSSVGHRPSTGLLIVCCRTAHPTWPLNLAERIDHAWSSVLILPIRDTQSQCIEHAKERPCRVDCEDNIVQYDE